jgi:hypothetical protein
MLAGICRSRRPPFRSFDPHDNCHSCIQRGSDELVIEKHDRDWVIHRLVVREHGVALAGPDPRTLIDPVESEALRDAVVSLLHGWWIPAPTCRLWLDNPFYRSYAVLTMCRMRYTLQYDVVVSETDGRALGASGVGREVDTADRGGARLVE